MNDNEDELLKKAYDEIYNKVMELIIINKFEPQMVAGTLMAQALKIYKTTLSDIDYTKMVQAMTESALNLTPIIDKKKLN
jgi:repressor of nif and glnA expression